MKPFFLVALVATVATHFGLAVETQHAATTVVVYVTVPRSSSPSHTAAVVVQQASNGETDETDAQSTDLQSTSSEASSTTTSGSSRAPEIKSQPTSSDLSSSWATSSQATSSQDYPKVTQAPNTAEPDYSEPGASSMGGGAIDTDGGASGSSTAAFHLSKGGLAAILVVVILVAIFGIASAILFVVAKRKQWTMRETLTRASRRLTGRIGQPKTPLTATAANRRSRRTGVRMESPPRAGIKAVYPPGHKRGLVVDIKDPEKGPQPLDGRAPKNTKPRENTWIRKLWGDGWK